MVLIGGDDIPKIIMHQCEIIHPLYNNETYITYGDYFYNHFFEET